MKVFVLITDLPDHRRNVQTFSTLLDAQIEKHCIEQEPDYDEETHAIEILERSI